MHVFDRCSHHFAYHFSGNDKKAIPSPNKLSAAAALKHGMLLQEVVPAIILYT
ncbi:hypothetical protein PNH38_16615 [Anoxybacillus rupiensis]|uniref:Uncharacterized protein n=1 Tax=Anoxybacteroides rupiense TaxID=311460 RepID=A0ABT5W825_9BACL|nr:hypothetical protein [Anoxybacillus rupiensis]